MLPAYCAARFAPNNSPQYDQGHKTLGRIFESIHHYCFAMNFMNRYYKTSGSDRRTWLKFALDDFSYMLDHHPQGYPLAPEIYAKRGSALRLMGRDSEAAHDYYKALELNPRLRSAYLGLADYFADKNQGAESLKIVTKGLNYLPGDKALQRRYTQMGGKLPYPEPLEQPAATGEKTVADNPAEQSAPAASASESKESLPLSEGSPMTGSTQPPDNPPPAPSEQPKFGTPKNPWCRFCPPE